MQSIHLNKRNYVGVFTVEMMLFWRYWNRDTNPAAFLPKPHTMKLLIDVENTNQKCKKKKRKKKEKNEGNVAGRDVISPIVHGSFQFVFFFFKWKLIIEFWLSKSAECRNTFYWCCWCCDCYFASSRIHGCAPPNPIWWQNPI